MSPCTFMHKLADPALLEPILNRDWPWCGFAIGDLEPAGMRQSEWWLCRGTLVLLFKGLSPPLLCHYGDTSGLSEILEQVREERVWANVRPDGDEMFGRFYSPFRCVRMLRMYLDRPVAAIGSAVRLTLDDRAEIEQLLKEGEWVLFLPHALADGHYYGVRDGRRLVAIAGTHLASSRFNIVALGSVFTHPHYRGQGLAAVCSSHALASTGRAGITRVVLNVEEEKFGARSVYERLGFKTACTYLDGECVRIQPVDVIHSATR